ncbi:MAG: ComEC/Rec2 family competence protein [Bacteroidota bacterium]
MLRITLWFALGILFKVLEIPYMGGLGLGATLFFGLCLVKDRYVYSPRMEYLMGLSMSLGFMGLGYTCLEEKRAVPLELLSELSCKNIQVGGTLTQASPPTEFGQSVQLNVFAIREDSLSRPIKVNILCKFPPKFASTFFQNDTLYLRGYFTPFQSPHASYKAYLASQGITHVLYTDTLVRGANPQGILHWGKQVQGDLSRRIRSYIPRQREQEIALAMFIGEKKALSSATRTPFVIAGASHILAISGMHIGIVFLLLNSFLGFLHFFPRGKQVKDLSILILLLFYMLLTGLSPAVVRATLMFGLILLFRIFFIRFHILNVIGTSALIQLIIDPQLLLSPGFQLSYAAVSGIVILFPWIERNCFTPWKVLNYLYAWIGISLCASLATAPFVWYHFGSFPVYFVLTNLLTSALSTVIVWVGFLLVLCLYFPLIAKFLGIGSQYMLGWLFDMVSWISQLPYAQLAELSISSIPAYILLGELSLSLFILFLPYLFRRIKFPLHFSKFDLSFSQVHR